MIYTAKRSQERERTREGQGEPYDLRVGCRMGCEERKADFKKHCCEIIIRSLLANIKGVYTFVILYTHPKEDCVTGGSSLY